MFDMYTASFILTLKPTQAFSPLTRLRVVILVPQVPGNTSTGRRCLELVHNVSGDEVDVIIP